MTFFEGKKISTIYDEMPSWQWNKAKFLSDWGSQIRTNKLWRDDDIQLAKEIIIKGFYATYEELLKILAEEKLSKDEENSIRKRSCND